MLVCDGMGGRAAGDVAAHLAAEAIKFRAGVRGAENVGQAPAHSLKRAVLGANQFIFEEAVYGPPGRARHGHHLHRRAIVSPDRLA